MYDYRPSSQLQTTTGIEEREKRYLHQPRNDNS
jgi:hypothetical protein